MVRLNEEVVEIFKECVCSGIVGGASEHVSQITSHYRSSWKKLEALYLNTVFLSVFILSSFFRVPAPLVLASRSFPILGRNPVLPPFPRLFNAPFLDSMQRQITVPHP